MLMPAPDRATVARRREIAADLRRIVPPGAVIEGETERRAYESDGLTAYRQPPLLAVLPETTDAGRGGAALLLRASHQGGAARRRHLAVGRRLAARDGILLGMAKFNRIKEIDLANRCVTVEPGVTNLGISDAVSTAGLLSTRPIRRARSPAPSAAMSPRIRAACIA